MKKLLALLGFTLALVSCSKDNPNYHNPYLPNPTIDMAINLNWPEYSELRHPNGVHVTHLQGVRGIIIFNTGSGFRAYEAACPNHPITDCSTLTVKRGDIFAKCACPDDGASFNLHIGTALDSKYQLQTYRISQNGNLLYINN